MQSGVQIKLRIPIEVHKRILIAAALGYRSVSAEIAMSLASAYGAELSPQDQIILDRASQIIRRLAEVNTAHKNTEVQ